MTNFSTATAPGANVIDALTSTASSSLTRRRLLAGAATAAAAAPVLGAGMSTPAAAATTLPLVQPVWSESIRRSFGIAVQPNQQRSAYGAIHAWPAHVAEVGAAYIRGKYSPNLRSTDALTAQCRSLGLKWVMTVVPEEWTMTSTELRRVLAAIRDDAADVCIAIEGINEPDHNRDGSPVRRDWAAASVAYQKVIWEFVQATPALNHVAVIGPTLQHDGDDPYPEFEALATAGLAKYIDYAGLHSYPGGLKPDSKLDQRLACIRETLGPVPTWVTETGYQNAMGAGDVGYRPVPTDVSATYGPRAVLEYFTRGLKSARYELLGDPDPSNSDPESSFGLVHCPSNSPSTWTHKPEFNTLKTFLGGLKDKASSYKPHAVPLQVSAPSNVKWTLTQKSDGTTTLLLYLNAAIWDVRTRTRITVNPVDVVVSDRSGVRTVKVGANVVALPIR